MSQCCIPNLAPINNRKPGLMQGGPVQTPGHPMCAHMYIGWHLHPLVAHSTCWTSIQIYQWFGSSIPPVTWLKYMKSVLFLNTVWVSDFFVRSGCCEQQQSAVALPLKTSLSLLSLGPTPHGGLPFPLPETGCWLTKLLGSWTVFLAFPSDSRLMFDMFAYLIQIVFNA